MAIMRRKKARKAVAMLLAISMCTGMITFTAAATGETREDPEITVTVENTEGGEVTTTTKEWYNGAVDGSEVTVETKIYDEDGNLIYESGKVEGSETVIGTEVQESEEIQEDQKVSQSTSSSQTTLESSDGQPEETRKDEWIIGTEENGNYVEGEWTDVEGSLDEGQFSDWVPTEGVEDTKDITEGVLPEGDPIGDLPEDQKPTLDLTPGGSDSAEVEIPLEDVVDANANEEQAAILEALKNSTSEDGSYTDEDGSVYTPKYSEDGSTIIGYDKVTTSTSGPEREVVEGSTTAPVEEGEEGFQYENQAGIDFEKPEDTDETDENGVNTKVTYTDILDENGNVIGYEKQTVVTTPVSSSQVIHGEGGELSKFVLPDKPAESETTDEEGRTTKVTVAEELDENGNVIGYVSTTVITDAEGYEIWSGTDTVLGSNQSTSTTTTIYSSGADVETTTEKVTGSTEHREVELESTQQVEITTTETKVTESWELVETEDGLFIKINGEMSQVVAMSGHADMNISPLVPTITPTDSNDLKNGSVSKPSGTTSDSQFQYLGYSMASDYNVDGSAVRLRKLVNGDGTYFYAYCIDRSVNTVLNTVYDIENIDDQTYFQNDTDDKATAHLNAIAQNAYWATSEGVGSLQSVKDLLTAYGYADAADSITDGEAMAATQAALWHFGASKSGHVVNESDLSNSNIKALYNVLISDELMNETQSSSTDVLDEGDITGAQIVVNKKADHEWNEDDDDDNDVYDTDVLFTLAVSKDDLTGDLKVHVYANGDTTKPIRTEDLNTLPSNDNGTYTIEDLQVAENMKITLNLAGTQNLSKGVYIYTATGGYEESQTFIGVSQSNGTRGVNLEMDLEFSVEEPAPAPQFVTSTSSESREKIDTVEQTRTDIRTDTQYSEQTEVDSETVRHLTTQKTVYADLVVSKVTEVSVEETQEWSDEWERHYSYDDDDEDDEPYRPTQPSQPTQPEEIVEVIEEPEVPLADLPEVDNDVMPLDGEFEILDEEVPLADLADMADELEILDEEVPLANIPITGDSSLLWAAMSLLSGGGLAGLAFTGKKRKDEE